MSQARFSIVVPAHRDGPAFRRCIAACLEQDYDGFFEVIVVSDRPFEDLPEAVHVVGTGSTADTSPAEKRDRALESARGDVLAYVDDDAWPAADWLSAAALRFDDPGVNAVGGPGLTPPDSPWRERVGGAVYESPAGSGPLPLPLRPGARAGRRRLSRLQLLRPPDGARVGRRLGHDVLRRRGHGPLPQARGGGLAGALCARGGRLPPAPAHPATAPPSGGERRSAPRLFRAGVSRDLAANASTRSRARSGRPCGRRGARPASPVPRDGASRRGLGGDRLETSRRHPPSVAAVTPAATAAHHLAYGAAFVQGFLSRGIER